MLRRRPKPPLLFSEDEAIIAQGMGYLQGLALTQVTEARLTLATARRVVMVNSGFGKRLTRDDIYLEIPWSKAESYLFVELSPPAETRFVVLTEREFLVIRFEKSISGGHDMVVSYSDRPAWVVLLEERGVRQQP